MAQFARPVTDVTVTGWTTQSGGITALFDTLNETVADDADYARASLPDGDVLKLALSAVADPQTSNGHVVRYRIGKVGSGTIGMTVSLRQGSTEIASWPHTDVVTGPTTYEQTLTAPQADAITDYTDLQFWFTATSGGDLQLFGFLWGRS